ncbi:MAG: biotin transporter BioY [Spirochaetaceae bacterium]|jgi:biotin transport system substrate-specific component|nr:biotin transporter BioY [Spirochaetaceae bacterium]
MIAKKTADRQHGNLSDEEARNGVNRADRKLFLVYGALFAALASAGAFISIPLPFSPVPVVTQNFFAVLAGLVLGPLWGAFSVALFLLAGALGVPVFSGAAGGFAVFARPSGGFLLGYLPGAFLAGLLAGSPGPADIKGKKKNCILIAAAAGLLVIYIPGLLRLKSVLGRGWIPALTAGFFPFIPGDIVKAVLAALVAPRLRRMAALRLYG